MGPRFMNKKIQKWNNKYEKGRFKEGNSLPDHRRHLFVEPRRRRRKRHDTATYSYYLRVARMGSYLNFKNFGDTSQPDVGSENLASNYPFVQSSDNRPFARQSSIYSLTFDEIQNTLGGSGKDFGSMNMEDFLKNIWTVEESQALVSTESGGDDGNLQRQGSITLPRTFSQKNVDQVWRDILKETSDSKDGNEGSDFLQNEPTLGEMTLEEFLSRAGVVREDIQIQPSVMPNETGVCNGLPHASGLTVEFQKSSQNNGVFCNQVGDRNSMLLDSREFETGDVTNAPDSTRTQRPLQPLFPKKATLTFSNTSQIGNNAQFCKPEIDCQVIGTTNGFNNTIVQGGTMVMGEPHKRAGNHLLSDPIVKSDVDMQTQSPSPYNLGEIRPGRKSSSSLEKVVERRRKRMLKNRESAARSRARKQAYTLELEAEISKLKEMNQDLKKKQDEFAEIQKNQVLEKMDVTRGGKRRCLTRTLTGPW